MTKIEIVVTPKSETLDPEARTIRRTLIKGGYPLEDLRAGRWFLLTFPDLGKEDALAEAQKIAESVLSNPVVHEVMVRPI